MQTQLQPRFGAILVDRLSEYRSRGGDTRATLPYDSINVEFQITGADREKYKELLDGEDKIRMYALSILHPSFKNTGGVDHQFTLNQGQKLDFNEAAEASQRRIPVSLYTAVHSCLKAAPLSDRVKGLLIDQLESHTKRSGDDGTEIPVKQFKSHLEETFI